MEKHCPIPSKEDLINFETPFLKNATASISSISMHYEHLYQKFWSPVSTQNMPSSASVASDALLPFPSLVLVVTVAHSRHSHLASRSHAQTDNVARVPPIESEKLPTSVQRVSKQTRHHKPITVLNFEVQHDIKLLPSCCSNLLLSPVNTHIHKQKITSQKKSKLIILQSFIRFHKYIQIWCTVYIYIYIKNNTI